MKKCIFCGSELPVDARFCGNCGHLQDNPQAVGGATIRSDTPPAPFWYSGAPSASGTPPPPPMNQVPTSAPGWPVPPSSPSGTPTWMQHGQYPAQENQEEQRRRAILPVPPFPGAAINSGQPYAATPMVQGTPQVSSVPTVAGTPSSAPSNMAAARTYPPPPVHHGAGVAAKVAGTSGLKWIIITVIAVVVVGAGGAGIAAYVLTRPQPVISATSLYKVGDTLAGASGTVLHVSGQKFSANSAITFLLDGNPAPGAPSVTSDASGNFRTNLNITSAWSVGRHILTARDASKYMTKNSVAVIIVAQGQAHTPGPFGAPADDASFSVHIRILGRNTAIGSSFTEQETILVTGHPDPTGGTSCRSVDNGKPHTSSSVTVDTNLPFTETVTATCTGMYKGGKLTYSETITSDIIVYSFATCRLNSPHVLEELSGSYNDQHMFSGTAIYPGIPQSAFTCDQANSYFFYYAGTGTWTGQVAP